MAKPISETVRCRWESRAVNDGKRQHLAVLSKTTQRGVFQKHQMVMLQVSRHLELEGKPYTVERVAPAVGAFQFYKQPFVGHKKSWSWLRNYLITHADFFLAGPANSGDLAQRKPVA